jgi:hypothetical protein
MFSLSEKVADSSMKALLKLFTYAILPLCPHIWPAHIIMDKFMLAEDIIIISGSL